MAQAATIKPDDHLEKMPDGSWVANYGVFTLRSAFQPIFRFNRGKLHPAAFEGLLRPFQGETPVITGAFFNSIAKEDLGIIETLARTLHVRNAANLHEKARRLYLNFDPAALTSKSSFESKLDQLGRELRSSKFQPNDCVCEITEKAAASESDLKYFVYALRARGYMIAIDDFGAASSDMARITALTPDIVKLDGPMVKKLMETPEGFKQLKSLLEKFHNLRIASVVEGLEEMWQIELAQKAGADMVQGFAAAVPRIVPHNFDEWFDDGASLQHLILPTRPASA